MATSSRTQDLDVRRSPLGQSLREHPGRYDFFQAVRLIERMTPGQPVGLWGPPGREVIRFVTNSSLSFPPCSIHDMNWPEGKPAQMRVNFMGLTGPIGVLPYSYTELVAERLRAKDRTLQDFFDLFNHRLISLFYQAWQKYRFFVAYERDQQDRFSRYLMSFVGLGTDRMQNRQAVDDATILYYSGLASLAPRSAAALEQVLADYFDVDVEIEQFVGAWYPIEEADQCCFENGTSYSEQLGVGAVAGDEIWDQQSRARIMIGPLTIEEYLDFLPGGRALTSLNCLVKFFAGGDLQFELTLILRRDDVPRCGLAAGRDESTMLGWTTWMKSGSGFSRDPADAIFLLN
jgi:type VI secretion system protein ImpH